MKALVATGTADLVELREVPEPDRPTDVILAAVRATSLNRGELHRLILARRGWRPGWDFAGVAIDGPHDDAAGVRVGGRICGYVPGGAWSERVAVTPDQTAALQEGVSMAVGATLPVAGITALRTLRLGGELEGKRVLITGAAGGVGRFAVQIAHQAGAIVGAIAAGARRAAGLRRLGADVVHRSIADVDGTYDLILESVGGPSLAASLGLVASNGTIVALGNSSARATTFAIDQFYPRRARLVGYYYLDDVLEQPIRTDLSLLVGWVRDNRLKVEIGMTVDWSQAASALKELRARRVRGKAVLLVDERDEKATQRSAALG